MISIQSVATRLESIGISVVRYEDELWVKGKHEANKEILEGIGFCYLNKQQMWYFHISIYLEGLR